MAEQDQEEDKNKHTRRQERARGQKFKILGIDFFLSAITNVCFKKTCTNYSTVSLLWFVQVFLKQTLIRMQFIKFFFSFRYQISRDLKAYTIVLFVVINGFLKRFFFVWNRTLALFLLQLITMKRKIMRCRFGMELNRGYKSWRISVWLFNKQKRKQGKSITYLFNAKNICVLLLS